MQCHTTRHNKIAAVHLLSQHKATIIISLLNLNELANLKNYFSHVKL